MRQRNRPRTPTRPELRWVARWLLAAAPMGLLQGCCQSSRSELVLPGDAAPTFTNTDAATPPEECLAWCAARTRPNCADDNTVTECGPAMTAEGTPGVRCVWRVTTCPQVGFGGACGRRPLGADRALAAPGAQPDFLQMALLEAASVPAFRGLRRGLKALGAPRRLLRAASRAAREERRHARVMRALARRTGVWNEGVAMPAVVAESAWQLALDNAVEGCVREAMGALQLVQMSQLESNATTRASLLQIARDELSHAAFARRIHAWIQPRLGPDDRCALTAAMQLELSQLATSEVLGLQAAAVS